MRVICGADGMKKGWFVAMKNLDKGNITWQTFEHVRDLIYSGPIPLIIAIDIPIGLPKQGSRTCDIEARRLLGPKRRSSVFPAPIRPILYADNYDQARKIQFSIENKKPTQQTWNILSKVRELDELLCSDLSIRSRVHEVHPEVCFYFLAGKEPQKFGKKDKKGREERKKLLMPIFGNSLNIAIDQRTKDCNEDDIIDAFVALWSAERAFKGLSQKVPDIEKKERDSFGLSMEIIA